MYSISFTDRLTEDTYIELRGRTEWCSETISDWHRESRHPYQWGYRASWHEDWMVPTVLDLRSWYMTEENLLEETGYGRGRWFASTVLDYTDFQPGLNAPLRWGYDDVATPFIGPIEQCHARTRDGRVDLTLKFDARSVERALGLVQRIGEKVPVIVTGSLRGSEGGLTVLGQDWLKVVGK